MNNLSQFAAVVALAFTMAWGQAFASQSVMELLDAEATEYVEALDSAQGESLRQLGIKLQDSGVVDPRVFEAANKVALGLHQAINGGDKEKLNIHIVGSMARFLASSSAPEYKNTLETIMLESEVRRLRNLAKTLLSRYPWYASRNKIMNDFSDYDGSQTLKITRLLNLIHAEDRAFGRYAAESMKRQHISDTVLLDAMAATVKDNYKNPGVGTNLDTIAWYIRTLGYAGTAYRPLLEEINAYPELDKKLRKHIKKALLGK